MKDRDWTAVLPDGRDFHIWEKPQTDTRKLHVHKTLGSDTDGDGSFKKPFQTIGRAAKIAGPGTRVMIHAGEYRETVRPSKGGTDEEHMVSYEAAGDGEVIIKASEVIKGFQRSKEYQIGKDRDGTEPVIWQHCLNGEMFHGYNPFGVINCIHEKEWLRYARVDQQSDLTPYFLRRGMIYVDGVPLKQVQLYRLMQDTPGSYWVEEDGMKVHFRMPDNGSPEGHLIEASCREQNFVPEKPYQSYIKVKGLTMLHAANGAPVPQRGALSCNRGHHWIIEDCVIQYANALGMDIGHEAWSLKKEPDQKIGYGVLRRNQILDSGVCGIAGFGAAYCLIEDNLIARTGWQHMEYGWEASALKLHECVDSVFRRNIFRDSDNCDGLWLDCNNYNDRITQNLFLNIRSPHAMIFLECNRGGEQPREILIDNNILWGSKNYEEAENKKTSITIDSTHWNEPFDLSAPIGEGIAGYGSDDIHIANNLIGNMDGMGYSQNVKRGRMAEGRGGTSRNSIVRNNVFYDCRGGSVRLPNHDNIFEGNYYSKAPEGHLILTYPAPTQQMNLAAWRRFEGCDRNGGYAAFHIQVDEAELVMYITTDEKTIFWDSSETEGYTSMKAVIPDGSVRTDFFGREIQGLRIPGPITVDSDDVAIHIDPRK